MEKRILVVNLDLPMVEGMLVYDGIKRTGAKQVGLYRRKVRITLAIMISCNGSTY